MTDQNPQQPPTPEQVISTPVGAASLDEDLKRARGGVSKVTIGLGVAVLVVAAFGGGVLVDKAFGSSSSSPAAQSGRSFPGGGYRGGGREGGGIPPSGANGFPGGFPGGTRAGGGTAGTVDHVDGTTVYLKAADGSTVKVSTSGSTQVEETTKGKVADLKPGQTLIVQGQKGQDGTVSAQRITERPAAN